MGGLEAINGVNGRPVLKLSQVPPTIVRKVEVADGECML